MWKSTVKPICMPNSSADYPNYGKSRINTRTEPAYSQATTMARRGKSRQDISKNWCNLVVETGRGTPGDLRRDSKQTVSLTGLDSRAIMQRISVKSQQVPLEISALRSGERRSMPFNGGLRLVSAGEDRPEAQKRGICGNSPFQPQERVQKNSRQTEGPVWSAGLEQGPCVGLSDACHRKSGQQKNKTRRISIDRGKLEIQGTKLRRYGSLSTGTKALNCVLGRKKVTPSCTDEDYQNFDLEHLERYYSDTPPANMSRVIDIVARENVTAGRLVLPAVLTSKCTIQDRYLDGLVFNPKTPLLREYARISHAKFYDFSEL